VEDYMRKHAMILALVLALTMALVFIGCGGTTDTGDVTGSDNITFFKTEPDHEFIWKVEKDQYSTGKDSSLGNKYKLSLADLAKLADVEISIPAEGDKFEFEFSFIPDATGFQDDKGTALALSFVDGYVNSKGPNTYWFERGKWSGVSGATLGKDADDRADIFANFADIGVGDEIEFKGTLTVLAASDASDAQAGPALTDYNFVFAMDVQPWSKPIQLYVTAFKCTYTKKK
jgi:hypothetical protein